MEAGKNWYTAWFSSPYYYLLYDYYNEQEIGYLTDKLLQYAQLSPGAAILDMACGRGRRARELAQRGYEVTGTDLLPENIDFARQYENDRLSFYQHDMRLPFSINYYDLVFNSFTGFGCFDTERENENVLRTLAQALKPGGIMVLDYLNSHHVKQHITKNKMNIIEGVQFIIRWEICRDGESLHKHIMINDPLNIIKEAFTEQVAAFTFAELTAMFARHGLTVMASFSDYFFNMFDEEYSPRLILTARKH